MTPHDQTTKHDPKNGKYGDCYRTAIACLLDMQPEDVPHVMAGSRPNPQAAMQEWLKDRGLWLLDLPMRADNVKHALQKIGTENPGVYWLLIGNSKNDIGHCVVCLGADIAHDPNPSKPGIKGPRADGLYYAQIIIPLSVTKP